MTKMDISNLLSYTGGALTDESLCDSTNIDSMRHSVMIVGWKKLGLENMDVWIIRNSYGTTWGDGGYMYIKIDEDDICGVAASAILIANRNIAPENRNYLSVGRADPSWVVTVGSTKYAIN